MGWFDHLRVRHQVNPPQPHEQTAIEKFNNGLALGETVFNWVGYTSLSGFYRQLAGTIEIVAAISFSVFHAIKNYNNKTAREQQIEEQLVHMDERNERRAEVMQQLEQEREISRNQYNNIIAQDLTYTAHGVANIIRGMIESIPILGAIPLLIYDCYDYRMNYPNEAYNNNPLRLVNYLTPQWLKDKGIEAYNSIQQYLAPAQQQRNEGGV